MILPSTERHPFWCVSCVQMLILMKPYIEAISAREATVARVPIQQKI